MMSKPHAVVLYVLFDLIVLDIYIIQTIILMFFEFTFIFLIALIKWANKWEGLVEGKYQENSQDGCVLTHTHISQSVSTLWNF